MTKKVHEQGSAVCSVKAKCQKAGESGDSIGKSAALLERRAPQRGGRTNLSESFPGRSEYKG